MTRGRDHRRCGRRRRAGARGAARCRSVRAGRARRARDAARPRRDRARRSSEAGLAVTDGAPRPRVGVALGTAFGCFLTNAAYQRRVATDGPRAASPRLFAATVSNAAAGEVGIAYPPRRARRSPSPPAVRRACSRSGTRPTWSPAGRADAMVAGGMDALRRDARALARGRRSRDRRSAAAGRRRDRRARARSWLHAGAVRWLGDDLGHAAGFTPERDREAAGVQRGHRGSAGGRGRTAGRPGAGHRAGRTEHCGADEPRAARRPRRDAAPHPASLGDVRRDLRRGVSARARRRRSPTRPRPRFLVLDVCPSGHVGGAGGGRSGSPL